MAASLIAMAGVGQGVLALLTLGLSVLSWIDDRSHVPIPVRFGAQLVASAIWIYCFDLSLGSAVAVIALTWMANLYNFMDGSDGLAGGMAVFGFGAYAAAAWTSGDMSLAWLCMGISAGAIGFLLFNFPPARIFMGDVGSVPLGFAAGALGYQGWASGLWPWWFPLLVFSPFIVDATLTLLRRAFRHQKVLQAHREHYYQRLIRMGWGHRKTALAEYALMLIAAVSAFVLSHMSAVAQAAGLACWCTFYVLIAVRIDHAWKASGQR
jgi:UDP-N-acetylmuramyl pentapeptide phosphotransferase/UDP-N-acetylglucosamine-1-phosphate transferase